MKASKHVNRVHHRLALLAVSTVLILGLCLVPARTGKADDEVGADGLCRTQSELPIYPDIISAAGWSPNVDNSFNVGFILNSNHRLGEGVCDLDKYHVIYRGNICFDEQVSPGFFVVAPCDCHQSAIFGVKVKFSQNYNINGGIVDSRRSQAYLFIDPNPYCFP